MSKEMMWMLAVGVFLVACAPMKTYNSPEQYLKDNPQPRPNPVVNTSDTWV